MVEIPRQSLKGPKTLMVGQEKHGTVILGGFRKLTRNSAPRS